MVFNMYIPTRVLFGAGQLDKLHKQKLPGKKALIVISSGKSVKANGFLARTEEQLHLAGVETVVFDKVQANPLKSTIMAGSVAARANNCDLIVALGGGSCLDAAKAIAMMATNDGDYWDYITSGTGKGLSVANKPLPMIAITTTAGTGSEVDAATVVTNEETHEKTGFVHESLFPVLAIVDPELMLSVPPKFTAYQGFDALFHSTEAYISNGANLLSDTYAITAIENISRNLAQAVKDGHDLHSREKVAFGNTLSGMVMCVGRLTSEHSLEHAMSAYHQQLPHGAGLIMLSNAYYAHFIDKHVCDERFVTMAKAMGLENAKKPLDFITTLTKLQEDCGVADLKMSDYGIKPDEFAKMAGNAMATMGKLFKCDRTPLGTEDCIAIYQASYR